MTGYDHLHDKALNFSPPLPMLGLNLQFWLENKCFESIFHMVVVFAIGGGIFWGINSLWKKAFHSVHHGLISMSMVNQQLVGKTR